MGGWMILILWLGHTRVLSTLKPVQVTVPEIVQSGSQVLLTCLYSTSPGEYIDSIKWYLNSSECYRDCSYRVLTFPPGGDCISLPQSGILKPGVHRLVILNASQSCAGRYICQVTESRPPFKTEQAAAKLSVLEPPSVPPILSGMESEYQQASILNVSCRSGGSSPPAHIHWTINGQKVPSSSNTTLPDLQTGLTYALSNLIVKLNSPTIPPRITVRCSARIGGLYEEHAVGRAVFLRSPEAANKPVPVLGEPLITKVITERQL